jgi:hypothetical protein
MRSRVSAARHRAIEANLVTTLTCPASVNECKGRLVLHFRDPAGGTDPFPVDRLSDFPGLKNAIVAGLLANAMQPDIKTASGRRRLYFVVKAGFLKFLEETERSDIELREIDPQLATAFQRWLVRVNDKGGALTSGVRYTYYSGFQQLVRVIGSTPDYRHLVNADALPSNPWAGVKPTQKNTDGLTEDEVRTVVRFCADRVRTTSNEIGRDLRLAYGDAAAQEADVERSSLLRSLLALEPMQQTFTTLKGVDPALAKRMESQGREALIRFLHPSLQDLIPYMVLFAVAFRLNSSVLVKANQDDFRRTPWIGGERIVARPYKPRSGRRQHASAAVSSDAVNPASMVELLRQWTQSIRRDGPTDRLFIFWTRRGSQKGLVVLGQRSKNWEIAFGTALRTFCSRNALPEFTLTKLRHFMLDLAHQASGGDIMAVRAAGGQRSLDVVVDHYVTPAGRRREDEDLALAMKKRQLIVATNGAYDPRRYSETKDDAVTPGWRCSRRGAASPFHPARSDGLCISYGRCPACQFGETDYGSGSDYGMNVRLLEAIDRSRQTIGPEAWLGRLAPLRHRLTSEILPRFSAAAIEAAAKCHLPRLPTLD